MSVKLSCVVVGSKSLLVQCSEMLLRREHEVRGVVTAAPSVKQWAKENGLTLLAPGKGLAERLGKLQFDWLFSISNLSILPAQVLQRAQLGAINFHDGPLPRYAGLNATSWALLDGEKRYGVSWHMMEGGVDQGDIVKQRLFDIAEGEKALTLNAMCFEQGIQTFEELIQDIEQGQLRRTPQDLSRRSYFGKNKRPAAACSIDWRKSARQIVQLGQALDFGSYPNPLGVPKFQAGGKVVLAPSPQIGKEMPDSAPAKVIHLCEKRLTVAAQDGVVELTQLMDQDGVAVPMAEFGHRYGVSVGDHLDLLEASEAVRLSELSESLARFEDFWMRRLHQATFLEAPFALAAASRDDPPRHRALELSWQANFSAEWAISVFCAWLSRLTGAARFVLGYRHPEIAQAIGPFDAYFAPNVPLRVCAESTFSALEKALDEEIQQLDQRATFARDLTVRHPGLSAPRFDLLVERVSRHEGYLPPMDAVLSLAVSEDGSGCVLVGDEARLQQGVLENIQAQIERLLKSLSENPDTPIEAIDLLSEQERTQILAVWNSTATEYPRESCVHELFEKQVVRRPDAEALVFKDRSITYRQLNASAERLAKRLSRRGVGSDTIVGLHTLRTPEMVVGILGIHKAGGAYLPLDPAYPADRTAFMIEDSRTPVIVTHSHLADGLPGQAQLLPIGQSCSDDEAPCDADPLPKADPSSLAYVIYTSGSTGKPKGVMVEHRNVVNFFAGMDGCIAHDPPGTWLAVTSLSFDISVLELCWTLARGFKVVLSSDQDRTLASASSSPYSDRPIEFSLFYFASDEGENSSDKYRLLMEGARFADKHGFSAVWTPERHFHAFGGLYPNPSVASACIAAITERISIRAGSCVLPLHHPIRIAEEWALVDNISQGRVGISFASGWHPNDFALRPENYQDAKGVMLREVETVRQLWRGEAVTFDGPKGPVEVRTLPRPVQKELPFWLTAAGNIKTFEFAGQMGAFLLTHLLGQSFEDLQEKIEAYRAAWAEAGHSGQGHITLMLHTLVGQDDDQVMKLVRKPLTNYLKSAVNLIKKHAWSFPTFKQSAQEGLSFEENFQRLSPDDEAALFEFSFQRYYRSSGLFGTVDTCLKIIDKCKEIGVNEIACLIDFGIGSQTVLESLTHLNRLRQLAEPKTGIDDGDHSIAAQIVRHQATHLQCTPSLARMLLTEPATRVALKHVQHVMVGGEAFAGSLAQDLRTATSASLTNMYGPTETTIWSSTCQVATNDNTIPLGHPIANTQIYIVDSQLRPVPVGLSGELLIGGDGVTRGYLNRPSLTADRFVADPFASQPGNRLYRSGDLARYLPDGNIEFLGRLDHQVKIRGYRIELGEIETALERHPAIDQAVLLARQDQPGEKRLVAYFTAPGKAPSARELREHLEQELPDFMIPSSFVSLPEMPLTPNKKVDRRALPAPERSRPDLEKPFAAPRSPSEKRLADIWGQVLLVDKVGIHDNFLDLGGDSIQAVQTVAKAAQSGLQLNVRMLLDRVNLADLAGQAGQLSEAPQEQRPADRAEVAVKRHSQVISPRDGDELVPLTYAQRPIWFLDQLEPGGHYNDRVVVRLTGALDEAALQRAINQIIRRHEALRTNFVVQHGQPVQVVQPHRPVGLPLVDLAQVDGASIEALACRTAAQASRRPFNLSHGPLLRIILIRLSESEHFLLLTAHQIINDSWSLGVWMSELKELYECYSTNAPVTLPALRIQYPDFAVWQQGRAGNGGLWQKELAYWKDQLAGCPSVLEMPTDHTRPAVQTYRGARNYFHIPAALAEQARQMSRRQGVTLFMTLLGVFNILLCRYSRQDDVLVGTPIAYRNLPELEYLIGDFINMLVLRTDLSGDPSFEELLARVREMALQAYAHPDLPLDKLVQELHPDRDASRNPLFQVMIEDQKPPKPLPQFRGLKRDLVEVDPRIARFDLTLEFWEMDGSFRACIEYSTDLFDAATIARMVGHFKSLLDQAVSDPRQSISAIPMLAECERHQLVEEWNASAMSYPAHLGIHQLFERQADEKPGSVAAILPLQESSGLTYGDLESRSNQLACHLRRAGLRPGQLAGLCVDRSAEMLVGLLGILKAGGTYVPLDPSYPGQRLQYMLEDSGASILLTQQAAAADFAQTRAQLICLDRDWPRIGMEEGSRLDLAFDPAQLAYVIYTSGSTGRPKGVQIPHQAVLNFLFSMKEQPGFRSEDVLLSVTTLSFDIAVLEIFLPFLTGGRVVLPSREDTFDGNRLIELLEQFKVSVMQATPSTWRVLLQAGWQGDSGLKILCGGEALPKDLAAQLCGGCESLWNMYGPTETTVWSSTVRIDSAHRISIGRPIANTQIHLLNHRLQPVPTGVSGQLHIGGDGLAQGYFGRPRMTAERFIPDPFAAQPGSRLYDSGDLARRLADGEIDFLGRLDHQLKIRGFRIEAGEIETTLSRHPSVKDSVVVARQDIPGDKRLVAYVVPRQEAPSVSVWRGHLKESLPDYMMPSAFVTLEEIPLTPNRKINRRALPAPERSSLESQRDYQPPRDTVERQLVNWWEDALGTQPIGVRADFFDLGGHSLLAAKLFSQIEETFGKRLPLAILFQKPTIEQLAEILRQEDWKPTWSCLVPIQPRGSKPPLFLVHGAGGNVLLYRDLALSLDADQPVYGLQSKGLDGSADALTCLEEMAAHYLKEVRSLQARGPYYLGGYCLGGTLAYEMARQLYRQGQQVAMLAMFETYNLHASSTRLSLPVRTVHLAQNVGFHLGNFMSLSASDRKTFLNRKASVARRRIQARKNFFKARMFGAQNGNHHSFSFIRSINDQAQMAYLPGAYSGRVTLFRPNKLFWGFEDPQFGWKDLVAGGVEVHELQVQPRAMLVAPLVRHLASQLQHCIDQAAGERRVHAETQRRGEAEEGSGPEARL